MGFTKAEALKAHSEGMKRPIYRENYFAEVPPKVRTYHATGRYTKVDLAVLFDLSVKDVTVILWGCG